MSVTGINHFNITAPSALLEQVRDFYVEVLGLAVGERPVFRRKGFWLYAGENPIVHLTEDDTETARAGDESAHCFLDHIAFSCQGLAGLIERLKRLDIPYRMSEVSALGQVQVFVRDPARVGVELNFAQEPAAQKQRGDG
jgi:catechol 2,3-dioxygenase-like lactoylglutathione lyase family enzyme